MTAAGTPVARAYYVYYRISPDGEESARRRADTLLAEVERHSGVRGRLARRCDDPLTWMEVYDGVLDADAFERALDQAELGWPASAARHRECFTPV